MKLNPLVANICSKSLASVAGGIIGAGAGYIALLLSYKTGELTSVMDVFELVGVRSWGGRGT
jgi:hypothetical protein